MQKFKRLLASLMMVFSLLAITPVAAHAEWKSNDAGWWYTQGSSWTTGWKQIDGNWYYFYSDGYMAHDEYIGEYYLNSNGTWTTPATSNTSSVSNSNDKTQMVYVASSGNGKKYHSNPNCSNMKGTRHITLSEAQSEGYGPCSKCW